MANSEWRMEKDSEQRVPSSEQWKTANGKRRRMANSEWRMEKDSEQRVASSEQ
jgi:hypothetical protein